MVTKEKSKNLKPIIILIIFISTILCLIGLIEIAQDIVSDVETGKVNLELKKEVIVEEPVKPQVKEPRYGFNKHDIKLLAQLLSGDGRRDGDGEYDIDYQRHINHKEVNKVLCVVMNRVRSNMFPDTVRGVVLQKKQFDVMPRNLSCQPSDKTMDVVREWCEKYDTYDKSIQTIPRSHLFYEGNGIINITRRYW